MSEENTEQSGQEPAVEETPGHTPETELETEAVVETPATEEETESVETPETESEEVKEEAQAETDDLLDLETDRIPKPDEIDKLRIKPEDKETYKRIVTEREAYAKQLEEIGGEFGVETFKPFAKILTKASASGEELDVVARSLIAANENVTRQLLTGGAMAILTSTQGDEVLQEIFGDNASKQNIKKLLALDKADFFDHDSANEYLRDDVRETNAFQQLEEERERLSTELAEIKTALKDPAKLQQLTANTNGRGVQAVKDFETDFYEETPKMLKPTFDRVNWGDGAHAKFVTELLQYRLKNSPHYQQTEEYLRNHGSYRDGDRVTGMAAANLHILKNLTEAQGRQLIRELQLDFRSISENSRNAKIVKEKEVAAKPKEKVETAPVKPETSEQTQARIDREYKEKRAQILAKAEIAPV